MPTFDTSGNEKVTHTVTSSALPTGAATSAKQDTIIGHIDGIEAAIDGLEASVDGIEGSIDGIEALLASVPVTNAGTFGVQVNGDALTALQLIDNMISGTGANVSQINGVAPLMGAGNTGTGSHRVTIATDQAVLPAAGAIAHDAADSGNPLKIGGKARTTNPTAVADADRVDATFDDLGRQVIVLNQVRDLVIAGTVATTGTTETTLLAAAASTFHDLTHLAITNASATATIVTLRDDTAGTIRAIYNIAANGGIVINFTVPLPQTTVNKNWTVQSSQTVNLNHAYVAVKNL